MSTRAHDERGLADSTSWALLMPVLIITVFTLISVGMWAHAQMGASTAASIASDRASRLDGDFDEARRTAAQIARQAGLTDVNVTVSPVGGDVVVTVSGRALLPVDLGVARIFEQAVRPREAVTRP